MNSIHHLTTGRAAHLCGVSQQTIIRSCDAGDLPSFRVPGSKFRRIPRDSFRAYMVRHGIPTEALDGDDRLARQMTTGDVGRALGLSVKTVAKLMAEGRLAGYRVPGSADRRFDPAEVEAFRATLEVPDPPR